MDIRPIGITAQAPASVSDRAPAAPDSMAVAKFATPTETVAAVQQPAVIPSMAQVTQAVKRINKTMESLSQGLEFSVDTDSRRVVVKIVDQATKEVIRQIPTEEALQIAKALDQVSGMLIKQTA